MSITQSPRPSIHATRVPRTVKVPAVERAVRLLDQLAVSRQPASLSALVRTLKLPKSSLHGLLTTLAALDLIKRTPDNEFQLGPRILQWAGAYGLQSDLVSAFNELAADHEQLAGDTVMLAVLDGSDVLYLACKQGSRALAVNFRVGGRFPAACTSSGKAMLSTLSEDDIRSRIAVNGLPKLTRHSVATRASLLRQLQQARELGFALDDEETAEGMKCFGAPVLAAGSAQAVAAVAVSLIKASVTPKRGNETIVAIRSLARRLSERLGVAAPLGAHQHFNSAPSGPAFP
jgi:IclR family transcriptional regulator, blcABC operon repressor